MYDELIKRLRGHHCDAKEDDLQDVCEECYYYVIVEDKSAFNGIKAVCICGLMHEAADAIEELQKRKLGKWIEDKDGFMCSLCGYYQDEICVFNGKIIYDNYCPNCGADMRD